MKNPQIVISFVFIPSHLLSDLVGHNLLLSRTDNSSCEFDKTNKGKKHYIWRTKISTQFNLFVKRFCERRVLWFRLCDLIYLNFHCYNILSISIVCHFLCKFINDHESKSHLKRHILIIRKRNLRRILSVYFVWCWIFRNNSPEICGFL